MRAYSMGRRERALADCDEGMGAAAAAAEYRAGGSWVGRLEQRRRATGETGPRPTGRRPSTWAPHAGAIRATAAQAPDAALRELEGRLGPALSPAALWRAVAALGLTLKYKSSGRRSATAPASPRSGPSGRPRSRRSTRRG